MAVVDGGPAFPLSWKETNGYGVDFSMAHSGMSLRDWFAANEEPKVDFPSYEVAAEFLGEPTPELDDFPALVAFSARLNAKLRYMVADAMLAARSKEA